MNPALSTKARMPEAMLQRLTLPLTTMRRFSTSGLTMSILSPCHSLLSLPSCVWARPMIARCQSHAD